MIYFLKKIDREINAWPKYSDEIMMVVTKKYAKIRSIGSFRYFMNEISKILRHEWNESKIQHNENNILSIFSQKVDTFVKTVIKEKLKSLTCKETIEKNIKLLQKQKFWQCFICKKMNRVTLNTCDHDNDDACDQLCYSVNCKLNGISDDRFT